jgi:hypothetical protein
MTLRPHRCGRFLVLLCTLAVPAGLAARDVNKTRHHHYKLVVVGTLGGPQSFVNGGTSAVTGGTACGGNSKTQVVGR